VIPSRERLRQAITEEWEPSAPIAIRASVNRRAAGNLLAHLHRQDQGTDGTRIEQRPSSETGRWEYRRITEVVT
jgi:uncharacterized membrane protein